MPTKYPFEKFTRVAWVPTIAAIATPTTTEIAAGTELTCFLTKDGLNPGGTTNGVDSASLCDTLDAQVPGSVAYPMSLKGFRFTSTDDDFWDLAVYGAAGHIVVRRGVAVGTAWAAAQKVEVYKGQFGEPTPAASATNAMQTFDVSLFVSAVDLRAAVTAGS